VPQQGGRGPGVADAEPGQRWPVAGDRCLPLPPRLQQGLGERQGGERVRAATPALVGRRAEFGDPSQPVGEEGGDGRLVAEQAAAEQGGGLGGTVRDGASSSFGAGRVSAQRDGVRGADIERERVRGRGRQFTVRDGQQLEAEPA
jgi:hypothetical protein